MTEPEETSGEDATRQTTPPGEESGGGCSTESRFAEPAVVVDGLRLQARLTTSMETATTTTEETSSHSANRATRKKATNQARSATKRELLRKHRMTEHKDENGGRYFVCRGLPATQEIMDEILACE